MQTLAPWMPAGGPAEFTVEMNPEDVTHGMVAFLRGLGVNRASLGIQSMHDVGQKVLKRCTPEINADAIEVVMREFDNVSFDVLLGVPKTTPGPRAHGGIAGRVPPAPSLRLRARSRRGHVARGGAVLAAVDPTVC
jgi:hypothetical protein